MLFKNDFFILEFDYTAYVLKTDIWHLTECRGLFQASEMGFKCDSVMFLLEKYNLMFL